MCRCRPEIRTPFCGRPDCVSVSIDTPRPAPALTIRRATLEDLHQLVSMGLRFIASTNYRDTIPPNVEQLENLVLHLLEHGAIFVADLNQIPVGLLGAAIQVHPMSAELVAGEIAWWINPEHRGTSAGLRLVACAEEWARRQGAKRFQMIAPEGSGLGRVYARRGYVAVETVYQRSLAA